MSGSVSVDFLEIEMAFEFANSDPFNSNEAWICRETGRIWYVSDLEIVDDPLPDDAEDNERYVCFPDRRDLDLGVELVKAFVFEQMPDEADTVLDMFRRPGAYRRFKGFLEARDRLDDWHRYENRATREALLAWCEENGIRIRNRPDAREE